MISIRKPVKALPGMLAKYTSEVIPKPRLTAVPCSTNAFGSRVAIRKKAVPAKTPLRMPTAVQRSWPCANKAQYPIRRQRLAGGFLVVAERGQGQRRHAVAGPRDDLIDDVDRDLRPACAQVPAWAFGQREIYND